jgi:Tfp pilus assembly protein PilP
VIGILAMSCCLLPVAWGQSSKPNPEQSPAPAKKSVHKKKAAPAATAAPGKAAQPAAKPDAVAGKRDPFSPLVNDKKASGPPLPPGKAGLVIATVHVDGTVKAASGMLAVVTNPDQRTYFLREGDRLYDGDVEKIGLDGVTFKENSKDAFGKPVERLVTKRIYPSAGEQQ